MYAYNKLFAIRNLALKGNIRPYYGAIAHKDENK